MVILVTGTPGTGKTTFAKKLARDLNYAYVDLRELAVRDDFVDGKDEERDVLIIDTDRMMQQLAKQLEKHSKVVLDGHFSHDFPPDLTEACYVLKTRLPDLKRRLEERGYKTPKVRENMDAEIFDTCYQEAIAHGHKVTIVWT